VNTFGRGLLMAVVCLALTSVAHQGKPPEAARLLPQTEGKTLTGERVVIAEAIRGRAAVLVITFSRKAGLAAGPWTKRLTEGPQAHTELAVFQVAQLQAVPRLFRGMVTAMIRRGTPRQLHSTLVVLVEDENPWKQFVIFQDSDVPYLVLLSGTGQAIWRTQGAFEEEKYAALRDAIQKAPAQGAKRD